MCSNKTFKVLYQTDRAKQKGSQELLGNKKRRVESKRKFKQGAGIMCLWQASLKLHLLRDSRYGHLKTAKCEPGVCLMGSRQEKGY